jgi:hypothetical protein
MQYRIIERNKTNGKTIERRTEVVFIDDDDDTVQRLYAYQLLFSPSNKNKSFICIAYLHCLCTSKSGGQDSVVGKVTLQTGRFGASTPVGARHFLFSRPSKQAQEPIQHRVSFPGLQQLGLGTYHPAPSSAEVVNEQSYAPTNLCVFMACYKVN